MSQNSLKSLKNKNAVVTGASMGIGRAVALQLAAAGANVVVNSSGGGGTAPGPLHELVDEIKTLGGRAVASMGSVANYTYAKQLIETCVESFGTIDILINCAGVKESSGNNILDMTPEDFQHVLDVHLSGTFNTCHAAAPIMVKQGRGAIINTGSRAWLGCYGGTAYPAAKGGTISLTWSMANDLKQYGIRCNVVCPGAKTRLSSGPDYVALIEDLTQRGLLDVALKESALNPAPPEFVAPLYAFLASDLAQHINGKIFSGAGGYVGLLREPVEDLRVYRDHQSGAMWTIEELADQLHL